MRRCGTEWLSNLPRATQLVEGAELGHKHRRFDCQVHVRRVTKPKLLSRPSGEEVKWGRIQFPCRPLSHPSPRDPQLLSRAFSLLCLSSSAPNPQEGSCSCQFPSIAQPIPSLPIPLTLKPSGRSLHAISASCSASS